MVVRNRWLSPGAIKLHAAVFVAVGACTAAFWWQLFRALHGHTRSWAYAVEWPLFAVYAVWMWWKLLREEPGFARANNEAAPEASGCASGAPEAGAGEEDGERQAWIAYNEYLARLSAANRQRRP